MNMKLRVDMSTSDSISRYMHRYRIERTSSEQRRPVNINLCVRVSQ